MNAHKKKGEVKADINKDFIKRFTDAGWKIEMKDDDISTLTVTAPKAAKAGDFITVPLRYTYTNGSIDEYSFSFVVQGESAKTEVVHTFESEIPFSSKEELDETLPTGTIKVITEGKAGKKQTIFKQVVKDGKKDIINEKGEFIEGDDKYTLEEKILEEKVDCLVKVGVKPVELTVNTGYTTIIEEDPTLDAGKIETDQDGVSGVSTVTTTRDPQTGAITIASTETTAATPKKVRVGTKCPTCDTCPAPQPAPTPTPAPTPQSDPAASPSHTAGTDGSTPTEHVTTAPAERPRVSRDTANHAVLPVENLDVKPFVAPQTTPRASLSTTATHAHTAPKHAKALPQTSDFLVSQILGVAAVTLGASVATKGMRKKKHSKK